MTNIVEHGFVQEFVYTKASGEKSDRVVIPTHVPTDCVKVIDVSDLSDEDRRKMQLLVSEYTEYVDKQMQTMYSFEDFVEHSANVIVEPKWRTFKISGISKT